MLPPSSVVLQTTHAPPASTQQTQQIAPHTRAHTLPRLLRHSLPHTSPLSTLAHFFLLLRCFFILSSTGSSTALSLSLSLSLSLVFVCQSFACSNEENNVHVTPHKQPTQRQLFAFSGSTEGGFVLQSKRFEASLCVLYDFFCRFEA